jgi:hypothetical protein
MKTDVKARPCFECGADEAEEWLIRGPREIATIYLCTQHAEPLSYLFSNLPQGLKRLRFMSSDQTSRKVRELVPLMDWAPDSGSLLPPMQKRGAAGARA